MSLIPTTPGAVGRDVSRCAIGLLGESRVGKTTLALSAPGTVLLQTEPGSDSIPGNYFPVTVPDWETFLLCVKELQTRGDVKRVVVDTFGRLCYFAQDFGCRELKISHPTDAGYGKGQDRVKMRFRQGMQALFNLKKQLIFVCHTREITRPFMGNDVTTVTAEVPSFGQQFLKCDADANVYMRKTRDDVNPLKSHRRVFFHGDETLEIGGRFIPGVGIPDFVEIPDYPAPGWPVVEAILRKGFALPGTVATEGASNGAARKKIVLRK